MCKRRKSLGARVRPGRIVPAERGSAIAPRLAFRKKSPRRVRPRQEFPLRFGQSTPLPKGAMWVQLIHIKAGIRLMAVDGTLSQHSPTSCEARERAPDASD